MLSTHNQIHDSERASFLPKAKLNTEVLTVTDTLLIDPSYPFYFQMDSYEMKKAGLRTGDILLVDRSLKPESGDIVIAFVEGCFYCRRYSVYKARITLHGDEEEIVLQSVEQIVAVVTAVYRNTLAELKKYRRVCTL